MNVTRRVFARVDEQELRNALRVLTEFREADLISEQAFREGRESILERIAEAELGQPVNKELFERTAPEWNCVKYPNDGMHYVPHGDCLWCGMTRDQIRDERTKNAVVVE